MACLTCHDTTAVPYPAIPNLSVADFSQQSCTNCHSLAGTLKQDLDTMHAGVTTPPPGYQPMPDPITPLYNKGCLICHADGQIDPSMAAQNHVGLFPIAAGDSHAYGGTVIVAGRSFAITCASCHVDANNRPNVDCTGCHVVAGGGLGEPADQQTAHGGIVASTPNNLWLGTGPVGTGDGASARCVLCHANDARSQGFVFTHGQAGPAATVFNIDATSGSHFTSCDQCHAAKLIDPNRKNSEFDFTQASCDSCHLPAGPNSIVDEHNAFGVTISSPYAAGNLNNSNACLGCHPDGGAAAGFSHPLFPVSVNDVHNSRTARCADCHSTQQSFQGDPTSNLAAITCTRCHNDASVNALGYTITQLHTAPKVGRDIWDIPTGYDYTNNLLCLGCHAGNVTATLSTPLVFRLSDHDSSGCMSDQRIADANGGNHRVDQSRDGVPICFVCHNAMMGSGSTPWARDWAVASCVTCHALAQTPTTCR